MGQSETEETPEPTFGALAEELSSAFVVAKRDSGTEYTKIRDGAPAWVNTDLMRGVHQAVDGRLPDDWIYQHAAAIACTLTGYTCEDADAARKYVHEIADGLVDVYTTARTAWLADCLGNVSLCAEAAEEYGVTDGDLIERIGRELTDRE